MRFFCCSSPPQGEGIWAIPVSHLQGDVMLCYLITPAPPIISLMRGHQDIFSRHQDGVLFAFCSEKGLLSHNYPPNLNLAQKKSCFPPLKVQGSTTFGGCPPHGGMADDPQTGREAPARQPSAAAFPPIPSHRVVLAILNWPLAVCVVGRFTVSAVGWPRRRPPLPATASAICAGSAPRRSAAAPCAARRSAGRTPPSSGCSTTGGCSSAAAAGAP